MDMNNYRKAMAAREEMLGMLNRGERGWKDTACIAVVYKDDVHVSPNQACHAGLANSYEGMRNSGAIAVVSALMKPGGEVLEEKEALMFLDWLLNRSPYSSSFITKSPHEALYHKAIISDAFTPSNLMAAGLVSSRRLWEYPVVARVFCDLVKAGVLEDLAYWLAHIAMASSNRTGSFSWSGGKSGHCSVDTYSTSKLSLKNFLEHKPTSLNKTYNQSKWYEGYHSMYSEGIGGRNQASAWVHENFPYVPAAKEKKVNPFKVDVQNCSCSYQYAIETMATFQHVLLEYIGYKA
ncbi:hypothetical protein D3C85_167020 [compost metagenome]